MDLWTLVSLVSTFALPQLLGVLLYFRLVRFSKWLAFLLGVLAPAIVFYFVGPAFFIAPLQEAAAEAASKGYYIVCGTPFIVAESMVFSGTVAQLFVALFVQLILRKLTRIS